MIENNSNVNQCYKNVNAANFEFYLKISHKIGTDY